jgi:hypothetical protein
MSRMEGKRTTWGFGTPGVGSVLVLLAWVMGAPVGAQPAASPVLRPVPGPVIPPPSYRAALTRGTRSADGRPGPRYWRNHARYDVRGDLDPITARITGSETIVYQNSSPDTMDLLVLHLHLNIHKDEAIRNEPEEITGGMVIRRLTVDGVLVSEGPLTQPSRWAVGTTLLRVRPPHPIFPGAATTIAIDWEEIFPQSSSGRVGWSDHDVYFVGYWYPRMAVYDDLRGWDAEPHLGTAEFYDDFGDYRVNLTVPAGWTVMATGTLENPEEVWSEQTRRRLSAARVADSVVHVASGADRQANRVTTAPPNGRLTYRFAADTVRDFAWAASNVQLWDATSARVPDRSQDGREERVLIHSFWREQRAPLWADQARYGKHAIEHHSRYTGFPYPWPHMTLVEGADIIGGGMEFPMLTLMGTYQGRSPRALYSTASHEIGHMWIPMIVGVNEKRYAWLDEGSTSFLENQSRPEYWPGDDADGQEREGYLSVARAEAEQPLMRHGDYYEPGPGYVIASYRKPATLLVTLRGLLGTETFDRAYRAFITEWAFRHPTPWDFFATFERFAGRDLDWFWTSFYYQTWVLDHAVGAVTTSAGATVVVIEDHGFVPMPARVRIQTTRGGSLERVVPVETWLAGANRAEITLPASVGEVTRVEIDPQGLFPDLRPRDNVWIGP